MEGQGTEDVTESKRGEWLSKGYPPELVDKGVLWARGYTEGIVRGVRDEDLRRRFVEASMPQALEKAEQWMASVLK